MFLKFERKSRYFFFILKSKSFQFFCKATAGLPYSPQNCRILLRAIYYAAGMPEEMKHYYVTNVDTEVTVFPETKRIAVINNADAEEKTDLYIKGHLIDSLTLAPREMRWVDDAE